MEVNVTGAPGVTWVLPLSLRELARALEAMAAGMVPASGDKPPAIELALLDDVAMAGLNREFLGLAGPTNVLSFPASGAGATGSMAMSARAIRREAWLYGQSEECYALRMLAHGLAHLLGYDHGSEMDMAVEKAVTAATSSGDGSVK